MKSIPAAALLCLFLVFPAQGQDLLPPGPGREETLKGCSGCHGIRILVGEHRSEYLWSTTVGMMVSIGAPVSDDEFGAVVAYLTAQFGPRPAPAADSTTAPRR
jgi:competence protein ComEA